MSWNLLKTWSWNFNFCCWEPWNSAEVKERSGKNTKSGEMVRRGDFVVWDMWLRQRLGSVLVAKLLCQRNVVTAAVRIDLFDWCWPAFTQVARVNSFCSIGVDDCTMKTRRVESKVGMAGGPVFHLLKQSSHVLRPNWNILLLLLLLLLSNQPYGSDACCLSGWLSNTLNLH